MPSLSKKYYHNIDLDSNQLIAAVIENRSSAPASGTDGQVYYNTIDKKIYYYNAGLSQWLEVGGGYVSSIGLSIPTGFAISGSPITSSGTLDLSFAAGYSLPTTASQNNWNTAYGWGNHALAGYLTSYTETDPTVAAYIKAITSQQISNWNTAYGWGDHASAGYINLALGDSRYVRLAANYNNPSWLNSLAWSKIINTPTTALGYGITDVYTDSEVDNILNDFVNNSRLLTINGVTYDLSENRSWTISTTSLQLTTSGTSGAATLVGDILNIPNYQGLIPAGGTTGQILAKIDTANYNTEWIDNYTSSVKHLVKLGENMTKGMPVYVSSADGTNMIVSKASYTGEGTSSKTFGILAESGSTNNQRFVITEGLLEGLNTSAASEGDPIWLGPNGTMIFGLANKPVAPNHLVLLGFVTRSQINNGEIFVKIQNGFEIEELHNVLITTVQDKHILYRDAATSLWKNASIATVLGYTPENTANKGTANGYASLDAGGKVPISQLPSSIMEYKGTWNASTNSPSLANGTGNTGDVYRVSAGGTHDFGSGNISFNIGDYVIYNGSAWEKSGGTDGVASVNGLTGVVTLTTSNITEGTNLYYTDLRSRGAITLTTNGTSGAATYNSSTGVLNIPDYTGSVTSVFGRTGAVVAQSGDYESNQITESATNLFYTNARARDAINVTTNNNSGLATYNSATGVINVPNYTLSGLGGVPTSRSLTINGTAYDLTADRTWTIPAVTSVSLTVPTGLSVSGSPITSSGTLAVTFAGGYSIPTTTSQSNWDSAYAATNAATSSNTVSTIVKRDANGKFITTAAQTDYIDYVPTTNLNRPAYLKGRLYYNSEASSLIMYSDNPDVELLIGERTWIRCRNTTGAPIPKGSPVYVSAGVHIPGNPVHGHHMDVAMADASDITKTDVVGITAETIADGAHGYVISKGYLTGINTSDLTVGGRFHLGFQQPGTLVAAAPEYPNFPVDLGICLTDSDISPRNIASITLGNPVQITTTVAHGFEDFLQVSFAGIVGTTQLNGNTYYLDTVSSTQFNLYTDVNLSIPLDGTGFTAYVSGGTVTPANHYGAVYVDLQNHSIEKLRVTGSSYIDGNLTVGGDLTIIGASSNISVSSLNVADNWVYVGAGDTVTATFTGSGLNDLSFRGHYTGTINRTFYVKISSTGASDTFSWSYDDFATTEGSNITITGAEQTLAYGIKVKFEAVTGHTLNDKWSGTGTIKNVDFGFYGNYSTPSYTHAGFFRDATDGEFKFFSSYTPEITGNVDTTDPSFTLATVRASTFIGNLTGNASSVTDGVYTSGTYNNPSWITGLAWSKITSVPANLTSLAGLTYTSGAFVKMTGANTFTLDTSTYLTANQSITLSGDLSGSGTTSISATIANQAVTYAKIQNVTDSRLLGRSAGTAGSVQEISIGTGLQLTGGILSSTSPGGSVTTVSVVSANGFAGTVANASSTPAITLTTTISGLLKGNGTAISAAVAGTDYLTSAITTIGTSGNGQTGATQTLAVGTSGADFNISSAANTHTFNIPDAGSSARGLITTGAQTIAGAKLFTSGLSVGSAVSIGNLVVLSPLSFGNTTSSLVQLLGSSSVSARLLMNGGTNDVLGANATYASEIIGALLVTEANSGTHPLIAQMAIRSLNITNGTATTSAYATLYIEGASAGTATPTNSYSVWVDDGTVRLDAALELQGIANTTTSDVLYYNTTTKRVTYGTAPSGSGGYTVTNQTTTYNATATTGTLIVKCDTTGGAFTVNLPTAVGNTATIIIKKTAGSAAVTVDAATTETIDGGLTATINKVYESITLISDNSNWQIV